MEQLIRGCHTVDIHSSGYLPIRFRTGILQAQGHQQLGHMNVDGVILIIKREFQRGGNCDLAQVHGDFFGHGFDVSLLELQSPVLIRFTGGFL
jgi:hypothetical protein